MATFLTDAEIDRVVRETNFTMHREFLKDLLQELRLLENAMALLAFTGRNGAGACTLTGAKAGDKVIGIINVTDGTTATASFESTITVNDQIQQSSAADLSLKKFAGLLIKKS